MVNLLARVLALLKRTHYTLVHQLEILVMHTRSEYDSNTDAHDCYVDEHNM